MNDNYKSRKCCLYIFGGRKYIKMTHNNSFKIVIKNDQTPDLTYSIVINSWNIADSLGAECGLPISWESEDNSLTKKMFGNGVKFFDCIDLHCEGEPARILTGGFPSIPGKLMSEKREFIKNNLQHIPKLLLQV